MRLPNNQNNELAWYQLKAESEAVFVSAFIGAILYILLSLTITGMLGFSIQDEISWAISNRAPGWSILAIPAVVMVLVVFFIVAILPLIRVFYITKKLPDARTVTDNLVDQQKYRLRAVRTLNRRVLINLIFLAVTLGIMLPIYSTIAPGNPSNFGQIYTIAASGVGTAVVFTILVVLPPNMARRAIRKDAPLPSVSEPALRLVN